MCENLGDPAAVSIRSTSLQTTRLCAHYFDLSPTNLLAHVGRLKLPLQVKLLSISPGPYSPPSHLLCPLPSTGAGDATIAYMLWRSPSFAHRLLIINASECAVWAMELAADSVQWAGRLDNLLQGPLVTSEIRSIRTRSGDSAAGNTAWEWTIRAGAPFWLSSYLFLSRCHPFYHLLSAHCMTFLASMSMVYYRGFNAETSVITTRSSRWGYYAEGLQKGSSCDSGSASWAYSHCGRTLRTYRLTVSSLVPDFKFRRDCLLPTTSRRTRCGSQHPSVGNFPPVGSAAMMYLSKSMAFCFLSSRVTSVCNLNEFTPKRFGIDWWEPIVNTPHHGPSPLVTRSNTHPREGLVAHAGGPAVRFRHVRYDLVLGHF